MLKTKKIIIIISILVAVLNSCIRSSIAEDNNLKIIHISDLHFTGDPNNSYNSDRIKTILDFLIRNASNLKTNIVVITGDITDSGDAEDYKTATKFLNQLKSFGFRVYTNPGNHDYCKKGLLLFRDEEKRKMFNKLTGYSEYPHKIEIDDSMIIIMLDSMKGEMDENTGHKTAQGTFGNYQLSKLKEMLMQCEAERKKGKKIILSLHHSPFLSIEEGSPLDPNSGNNLGLSDGEKFLGIIANKIDCLIFGHTTPDNIYQLHYPTEEYDYGIPLINCENLENIEDSNYLISVIDLGKNQINVYHTKNSTIKTINSAIAPSTDGTYHITPIVIGPNTVYNYLDAAPSIKFQSRDKVTIIAGGGVQTGGYGKTWKRYVNPSGPGSDHLYFGEIYIPGITSGLTPIRDLVSIYGSYDAKYPDKCILTFIIPKIDDIPEANRYLSLGYQDDDYTDNGYWGHDDGTEEQCKNVGKAYVNIEIKHSTSIPPFVKNFNISPPIVNKNIPVEYNGLNNIPAIFFNQGDKVTIIAGGGVQTGGYGKTWKRYVNPSGPGSDHLYFGEIYIPGITSSLTPIRDLVSIYGSYDAKYPDKCILTFIIPKIDDIPEANRYLSLHYIDDNYSDNGYWGHDDGTDDQCKNVGKAYVQITIQR